MRLDMPSAMPADLAEVLSDVDDYISAADQQAIDTLADQKLSERFRNERAAFADLMAGIDPPLCYPSWQDALALVERSQKGQAVTVAQFIEALYPAYRDIHGEAQRLWRQELTEEAESEFMGVEA